MNSKKSKQDYEKYLDQEIEVCKKEIAIMTEIILNYEKLSKDDLKTLIYLLKKS